MTEVRELSEAPSMRSLYPRALIGFVPGGPDTLPATELLLNDVAIDRGHLTAYERVCGFRLGDDAPSTYPHLLGFPLQMKLMTGRDFPFPAIGLVHVENRIEQHRPLRAGETVSLRVHPTDLRDHDKGRQFDMVADVRSGGETVWRSRSTYLRRGGGLASDKKGNDRPQAPQPNAIWDIPGDTGRRYGSVSGDRNPIHLHSLSAKLFGMRGAIAHGMWLKARSLAALEDVTPESHTAQVGFKLPVVLPAEVGFSHRAEDGGRAFAVHDAHNGKPHLSGRLEAL